MYGNDYRYANTRLNGTIVRRGDHPVMIKHIENDGTVHCETVITRRDRMCEFSELDLSSPELGMVNTKGKVIYLARCPKRDDWRQGLRRNNLKILMGGALEITDKLIYRAIRGRYPTLEDAIADSMEDGIPVAFHRHWAVSYDHRRRRVDLLYKWYGKAGTMDTEGGDWKLVDNESFQFSNLIEALGEAIDESN